MPNKLAELSKALIVGGVIVAAATGSAFAAEITFFCGMAMRSAMTVIIADFEKSSGHSVKVAYANTGTITDRIRKGEVADLAVLSPPQWDALRKEGRLASDFRLQVARIGIGVAVKKGAPKPDIGSADALRRTLLNARAVAVNDPAQGSQAGAHALAVLDRLGIAAEMKPKTKLFPDSPAGFQAVARGEADLAITLANLIADSADVDLAGGLPAELQSYNVLVVGIPKSAREAEAAKSLADFLKTSAAAAIFKARGIDPG